MLRSALIASAAILAVSVGAAAPASAKILGGSKVVKVDAAGNRVSKTNVFGTNKFGDLVVRKQVVVDPAGPGKFTKTTTTRFEKDGDRVTVTNFKVGF